MACLTPLLCQVELGTPAFAAAPGIHGHIVTPTVAAATFTVARLDRVEESAGTLGAGSHVRAFIARRHCELTAPANAALCAIVAYFALLAAFCVALAAHTASYFGALLATPVEQIVIVGALTAALNSAS